MARDITTNLRFPERIYRDLQYASERRGISMASVVREAVAAYLGRTAEAEAIPVGGDPADRLIGSITSGPDDESVNHDRYLYGSPAEVSDETERHLRRQRQLRDLIDRQAVGIQIVVSVDHEVRLANAREDDGLPV